MSRKRYRHLCPTSEMKTLAGDKRHMLSECAGTAGSAQPGGDQVAGSAPHAAPSPWADLGGRRLTVMALDHSRRRPGQEDEAQEPSLLSQWWRFLGAAQRVTGTPKQPHYLHVHVTGVRIGQSEGQALLPTLLLLLLVQTSLL